MSFFHAELTFFLRRCLLLLPKTLKRLSVNEIATPFIFALFAVKRTFGEFQAILSVVKRTFLVCFVKKTFCVVIKGLKNVNIF